MDVSDFAWKCKGDPMRFKLCVAMLSLALLSSSSAFGAVITDAVKLAGNATAINLVEGGLADGVDAYTDRNHVLPDFG